MRPFRKRVEVVPEPVVLIVEKPEEMVRVEEDLARHEEAVRINMARLRAIKEGRA